MCFSSVHGAFIQLGLCNAGRHHLPQTMEVSSVISFPYEIPSILCTPKWIDSILNRTKPTFLRWCCQSCFLFLLIMAWMPIALHDVFFFSILPGRHPGRHHEVARPGHLFMQLKSAPMRPPHTAIRPKIPNSCGCPRHSPVDGGEIR